MGSSEQDQMQRKHVFAVNGAVEFLDVLRELLQEEKYNVTTTNFVPQTFAQIETLQPQLLVVDLAVGVRAGWDLLERLTAEASTRAIPVVVFSTSRQVLEEVQANSIRFGGQRFLRKPVDLDEIVTAIDELIGRA